MTPQPRAAIAPSATARDDSAGASPPADVLAPRTERIAPNDRGRIRGRTRTGVEPADVALFVPRAIFFPLYLFHEFLVRRPIVAATAFLETTRLHVWIPRILHPIRQISWSPAVFYVSSYRPLFGVNVTVGDIGYRGHEMQARFMTGGAHVWNLMLQDRLAIGKGHIGLRGSYFDRPDLTFFGLGPRSSDDVRARYRLQRREMAVFGDWSPSRHFGFEVTTSYRIDDTGPGDHDSIDTHFDANDASQLPGFGALQLWFSHAAARFDTRVASLDRTGFRVELDSTFGLDPTDVQRRFVVGSVEVQGAIEVVRPGRVLVGSIYVADSSDLGGEPVPFTYLPALGGPRHFGFQPGRFTGQSAAVAQLEYRYPVYAHLDGEWITSVGNVFGPHLQGFDPKLLTASFSVGFRTRFVGSDAFHVLFGLGTTTFDQPFAIDSVRFALSVDRGL